VFGRKTNKVKIQMYHRSEVGDLELSPWERSSMLKPMIPPKWFKTMKRMYEDGNVHTLRTCPSFVNILTTGYVIHNKVDTVIRNNDGEINFGTYAPPSGATMGFGTEVRDPLETHSTKQFTEQYPFENGFCKFSLKFRNEWFLRSNVDVTLMILPCWWDKVYNDVRAIHGMVTVPVNFDWSPHINTVIRIPKGGEEYLIPADAPIAHVIPVNLSSVSLSHNQKLLGDDISRRSSGLLNSMKHYRLLSDKVNNMSRMFRLNKKG
jgi:hypothetical protein